MGCPLFYPSTPSHHANLHENGISLGLKNQLCFLCDENLVLVCDIVFRLPQCHQSPQKLTSVPLSTPREGELSAKTSAPNSYISIDCISDRFSTPKSKRMSSDVLKNPKQGNRINSYSSLSTLKQSQCLHTLSIQTSPSRLPHYFMQLLVYYTIRE